MFIINYIRLHIQNKKYNYKFYKITLVKDVIKYFFFLIILFQTLFSMLNHNRFVFPNNFNASVFITSVKFVLLIILSSLLISHFTIRITTLLPSEPFWRFSSKNKWFIQSYIYPVFSSTLFIVLFTLTAMFYFKGIIYFFLFYLIYLLSVKQVFFRIFFFTIAVLIYFSQIDEKVILIVFGLLFILTIAIDRIQLDFLVTKKKNEFYFTIIKPIVIIKEIKYFFYYSSEQVYNLIAIIIFFYIVIFNINSGSLGDYPISVFAFPAIAFLSFSQTFINLFGMDTNAVKMYFYNYDKTIDYLVKRVRIYQYFTNFLCAIFLGAVIFIMKLYSMILPFILGVIIFNELILSISILVSILFIEKKEVKWKFGQYSLSKNVNLLPFVLVGLVSLIHYSYKCFNIEALLLLVIISIYINIYQLKSFAVKLMRNKILKGKEYV